jgi:hypothetical protein
MDKDIKIIGFVDYENSDLTRVIFEVHNFINPITFDEIQISLKA